MRTKAALLTAFLVYLCATASAQTPPTDGGVIEGDIVDGDTRQGISGARVKLESTLDGPWFTFADRAGHFRFTGLTEESYSIAAQQIGYMGPQEGPQSYGGFGASFQTGHAEPLRIILIRYGVIAGTVTDSSGAPVSVAGVTLLRGGPQDKQDKTGRSTVAHVYTDQRGAYRIARLRPGTYYLLVEGHSRLPPDDQGTDRVTYYGGALDLGGAKPIQVARGRTISNANVEILRRTGVRVSGRIVKPASQDGNRSAAPVMTMIWLRSVAAEPGTAGQYANTTGDTFEIQDVLPGKYTLTAVLGEMYGRPEARRNLAAAIQTIEVNQAEVSGLTVALDRPHDLTGTVHVGEGCHQGAVHLTLTDPMQHGVAVNGDSSFVLKDLLPAQYSLSASIQGERFAAPGALRLGGRESQRDFIMEGGDFGPLQVEVVCPRGSITGEVRDADGAPAETATIAAVLTEMVYPNYTVNVHQAGGRFDIPVAPGLYDIFACTRQISEPRYSRDCQMAAEAVTVKDGTNARLLLTLPPQPKAGPQ